MNARKITVRNSKYSKFLFLTKEDAEKAKKELEKCFPNLIFKVTKHGGLFCQTFDRRLHEQMLIMSKVLANGGTKA